MKWQGFSILFLSSLLLHSQSFDQFLLIDPLIGSKREKVMLGDYLSVKCLDKSKYSGFLQQIHDSTIVIGDEEINVKQIRRVKLLSRRDGLSILTDVCLKAGLGYAAVVSINGLINDDSPTISESTLKISGGFLAVGLVAAFLNQKSIKIKETWQIKLIDFGRVER